MRIYYFSKGNFNKNYFLDSGKNFGDNRKDLGSGEFCDVLESLKKELDFKRKSIFYIVNNKDNIKEKFFHCLNSLFTGSKISLEKKSFSEVN